MSKYKYITKITKGVEYRYRTWVESFVDEDTGDAHDIKRHMLIKVGGKRVFWNPAIK